MSDQELKELGDWVITTCLMFGASLATAYAVAGHFIAGVVEWQTQQI